MEAGTLERTDAEQQKQVDEPGDDGQRFDPAGAGAADDKPGNDAPDLILDLGGQLTFDVGGKKVTSSSLRIVGGKVDLDGQLEKGEGSVLRLEVVVTSVSFVDKVDGKTGSVTGCERQHKAQVRGVAVVTS